MLQVSQLTVGYGQSAVITDLDFAAVPNETLAIMGRNGMGKTTLFKALLGILPSTRGSITLNGVEMVGLKSFQRVAHGLAYVPQGRMIFPALTVQENIETGLERSTSRRIPDDVYALFPVLRDMSKRKGGNLSGGQQQQLAMARALVTEPHVLLLDEPTEGIQPSVIKDIAAVLKELRKLRTMTIIVSEQVLSFALSIADRFLVLERGHVVYEDLRSNVNEQVIARYLSV